MLKEKEQTSIINTNLCSICAAPAMDGEEYCRAHVDYYQSQVRAIYEFDSMLATQIDRLGQSRSLREEIGLVRATLERVVNDPDTDLVFRAPDIIQLTTLIERLIKTAHTVEKELSELLTYEEARALALELLTLTIELLRDNNAGHLVEELTKRYAEKLGGE